MKSKQRPVMCDLCKVDADARRMEIFDSFVVLIMVSKVFRSRGIFLN